jgi:hypothetical protein
MIMKKLQKTWLRMSGGLTPDEVELDDHDRLCDEVAVELGVNVSTILDPIVDWGSGEGLNALHGL